MAVRYPGRATDEGATPPSPERAPGTTSAGERAEARREVAHPRRVARHTPARGTAQPGLEGGRPRAGEAITCIVPAAATALVREALAVALPGVPVTVIAEGTTADDEQPDAASLAPAWAALRRTQQRVAASDAAMRLQHALANPLTALLFEAQLLEMEPLPPAPAEAVGRILTQCRRTIEVARRLDPAGAAGAVPVAPVAPVVPVVPVGEGG